jgi:Ser/Thr protein kinase RdoA (MazF antagonist)
MSGAVTPADLEVPPAGVMEAWDVSGCTAERVHGGLINGTFLVRATGGEALLVLQRLHPIFAAEVNLDLEAVSEHLAAAGLLTPRLVRTASGERWLVHGGSVWRALTYVEGVTMHRMVDADHAAAAGELVGRFHRALADFDHEFVFRRAGVHDTAAHLGRLARAVVERGEGDELHGQGLALAREILDAGARLPPLGDLPPRAAHGDLKVSNILFGDGRPARALCLIDLDTLGRMSVAYEMGDALRSWCNPEGEDTTDTRFDLDRFAAAVRGYAAGLGGLLSSVEVASLPGGLETVCVELAARFCVDVFDDRYFGWNQQRFESRRHHNLVRARGQLTLGRAVAGARQDTRELLAQAFSPPG